MTNLTLDQKLIYIGIQLSGVSSTNYTEWIDIEKTLFEATLEITNDTRLFSLLCSWVSIHGNYVIIEKLMKLNKKQNSPWLIALAIFASNIGMHRWSRLIKKQKIIFALVDADLASSSILINGEEPNFKKFGFLIPKKTIRVRASDTNTQEALVKKNLQYRNRLLFGASWRADIITAIQVGMKNPYQIAKTLGCSYEPAHRIFKEYTLATK